MKRRQNILFNSHLAGGKLRQTKMKKWFNRTKEIPGSHRSQTPDIPEHQQQHHQILFCSQICLLAYTGVFYLNQDFHVTASFFLFFSVHKLINFNYMLHFMPHLRSKCALYQRQVVKLQAGWADPPPSPAWPSWMLGRVMGRTVMARRKATMTSANINKFHSPWTQQGFISTGRNQKYIGWRILGKLKMHLILPPLKWIPRGVQSV